MNPKRRLNWTPYLLLLPSLIYLAVFFAWPMVRSLTLALRTDDSLLNLHAEADPASPVVGQIRQNAEVSILDSEGRPIPPADQQVGQERWYRIRGADADGRQVEGWAVDRRIREEETVDGSPPARGEVRRNDLSVQAEPGPLSVIVGTLPVGTPVDILEIAAVQVWFRIGGDDPGGQAVEGWADSSFIELRASSGEGAAPTAGRVRAGDAGEWTLEFIQRMVTHRDFDDAVITTFLLIIIILPLQFGLAIVMALVLQERLRGNSLFLYLFTIPLGISDLATGIVWYAIFTQSGFLNSLLQGLGLIQTPFIFIDVQARHWMILAVVLAEVWRATSIVMVIVVSGLQAVPREYLEAAELFGAGLWQRLRHVILPLLKPSLQVALILRTILAFQVFAVVIAIAGRGLTVLAYEAYRWYGGELRNEHLAAAYAGFILLISMFTALFYLRAVRTQEEVQL